MKKNGKKRRNVLTACRLVSYSYDKMTGSLIFGLCGSLWFLKGE